MDEKTRQACSKMLLTHTIAGITSGAKIREVIVRFLNGQIASGFVQSIRSNPMSGQDTIMICRHSCSRDEDGLFELDLAQVAEVRVRFYDGTEQVFP